MLVLVLLLVLLFCFSPSLKLLLRLPPTDVDVVVFLVADGCLPCEVRSAALTEKAKDWRTGGGCTLPHRLAVQASEPSHLGISMVLAMITME